MLFYLIFPCFSLQTTRNPSVFYYSIQMGITLYSQLYSHDLIIKLEDFNQIEVDKLSTKSSGFHVSILSNNVQTLVHSCISNAIYFFRKFEKRIDYTFKTYIFSIVVF